MKLFLNKKFFVLIICVIVGFLTTNHISQFHWYRDTYDLDWIQDFVPQTNYILATKLYQKMELDDQEILKKLLPEDISSEELSSININDFLGSSFLLDDPNISYMIKDNESGTIVSNTKDISDINEKYRDYYTYLVSFTYGDGDYFSYYCPNEYPWNFTLTNYREDFYVTEDNQFHLKPLEDVTITYAINMYVQDNCESYYYMHPISNLNHFAYDQINNILAGVFIISLFLKDSFIFGSRFIKEKKLASFLILVGLFLINYYLLSIGISSFYHYKDTILLFISSTLLLYTTILIGIYIKNIIKASNLKNIFNKINLSVLQPEKEIIILKDKINNSSIHFKLFLVSLSITFIIIFVSVVLMSINTNTYMWFVFVLFLIIHYFVYRYIKTYIEQYQKLLETTKKLSQGHFDVNIDEELYYFKDLQKEFTHIKDGFEKAVIEEVKSERMKTELITNVSHDLKTPLTSIITYVDLLKKDNNSQEDTKNYINVLERSSLRLKRLIEDLFDVTKANTGNVKLNFENVDIISLVKQAQFECSDILTNNELIIKENYSKDKYILSLDSLKTFRIFENLFNNAGKYALPHTRVYVDIADNEEYVIVTIKNISAHEMNFNGDEIVERFVRGDKSRNTAGSGLGLAIAKSFTEIQNGKFKIDIDGDLFKAIVQFKKN